MKKLIILTAIPGAGKSTWAKNYAETHENCFVVSSDEIRKELGGTYQYFKEEDRVWEIFLSRTKDYAKNYRDVTVILDSTNLNDGYREMFINKTPEFDFHSLVYLSISFELACKRNFDRHDDKIVPLYAMEKMNENFKIPSEKTIKMFDEYVKVDEH